MSYSVPDLSTSSRVSFDPGTNLLITGPTAATEDVLFDILTGDVPGETSIVITTNQSARDVLRAFEDRGADPSTGLGIVDASGQNPTDIEGAPVEYLGSPGDLTGISLDFAKLVQQFQKAGVGDRVRVGLASISTLLMYGDVQTVFRFLHVFTSRIRSGRLFGAFTLDPGMHDDQTTNTVRAIFDAEVSVDDGSVSIDGTGFLEE